MVDVVVVAVAVSSPGFGSTEPLETFAVFVMTTPLPSAASLCTTSVNTAVSPFASAASLQVTVPVPPTAGVVQVNVGPPDCVMETNVVFVGTTSVSTTFDASFGPPFETVIV